jgi:hypothetical protein
MKVTSKREQKKKKRKERLSYRGLKFFSVTNKSFAPGPNPSTSTP